ncbi:MAG: CPBP family intramembrane metalloprotease [Bacteroidales bacterium]|nr:CPBP family intramembrane metalloprotease [Bacteroidales bacterium]
MDEFKKNLRESSGFRFFIYVVALLLCTVVGLVFTMLFADKGISGLKIGQGLSSTMMFIVPPLILYLITRTQPLRSIGFRKPNSYWLFLIGLALMFVSLPITNILGTWNENMYLGAFFAKLEEMLKQMEDAASEVTEQMLEVDSIGGLLGNLLVIALIPAIGEELTFRGVLQQWLTRHCKSHHVAIIIAAAIFSFIHFQFYGFLPRMFLGLLLGYMFYYSGSIWTSILMHFVNNGTAVVVAYLQHVGAVDIDYEHFGASSNILVMVCSLVLTIGLIYISNLISKKYGRQ